MSTAFAAPSLKITSPPVLNNLWTGPAIDPTASAGQWFVDEATREITEVRTHEFYDNVLPDFGGGTMSYSAIEGKAAHWQYSPLGNLIAFDIVATITNDTPALSSWLTGSNRHGEVLSTPDQYEGTLFAPKLTAEFAIADFICDISCLIYDTSRFTRDGSPVIQGISRLLYHGVSFAH